MKRLRALKLPVQHLLWAPRTRHSRERIRLSKIDDQSTLKKVSLVFEATLFGSRDRKVGIFSEDRK